MLLAATVIGRRQAASLILCTAPSISVAAQQQKRTIYSKYAVPDYAKHTPPPWPYKERGYNHWLHQFLDYGVSKRLGENSKLIVVEGNVGSGKSKFAQELADHLGFYHVPDPDYDTVGFIDSYGEDQRLYYHLLPETVRRFDTRMFYEQPNHRNVVQFQHERFQCRVEAYLNALAHILNTGQGVVMERCFHTDQIFLEAMHQKGYISDAYRWHYHKWLYPKVRDEILLEAHCVIYLDCPVDKCMENIKKHHKPWEWKNEVMDYSYLEHMDKGLKNWLKEYSRHAEIVTYDWKDGGDARTVAEDLERIDLDDVKTHENEKFETWTLFPDEDEMVDYRSTVTSFKKQVLQYFYHRSPQVEEMWWPIDDMKQRKQVFDMIYHPYAAGFRADRGDSRWDITMSWFRDMITNKKWNDFMLRDEHHLFGHDLILHRPDPPETPTFPEEFLQPRSPYKSDGGCAIDHQFFLVNGRLTMIPH